MESTLGFAVTAFGCNVRVEAGCGDAYTVLDRFVFPSLPRVENAGVKPDIVVRIATVGAQFQLSADDRNIASARDAISLVPALVNVLDDAVIERLTSFRAVHAGAVAWNGRAMLLPGATHAGKSTLVAELLRRGATYFSDEYALIDPEGRVHPYPRPLLLRNGQPQQVPALAADLNAPVGASPAPVAWILSLDYHPAGAWAVAATSQSEALLNLLRNTPHTLELSPGMTQSFRGAVAGASCYSGSRADAADAARRLLQMVAGAP
jgi:hypothetical protein